MPVLKIQLRAEITKTIYSRHPVEITMIHLILTAQKDQTQPKNAKIDLYLKEKERHQRQERLQPYQINHQNILQAKLVH